ncbi:MAG TPA: hypothetical protein VGL38_09255 [bacterium]
MFNAKGYLWSGPYPFGPRSTVRAPAFYLILDADEDPRAVGAVSRDQRGEDVLREQNMNPRSRYLICYQTVTSEDGGEVEDRLDFYRELYEIGG